MKLALWSGCAVVILFGAAPAVAMPHMAAPLSTSEVEQARLVCGDWECWEEPDYHAYARPRYRYEDDGYTYGSYYRAPRPPTKWERKGFCPPGQHKKGIC